MSRLNIIGDEVPRKAASAMTRKAFLADQPRGTETLSSLTSFQNVSANAEVSSSVQPVRAQDIIAQIADLQNAQPDPSGRVKIVLDPPNLGTVEMDIAVRGNRVSAVMTADSSQVRQILQSHAEEMKQALVDQGFRIDHIEVRQPEDKGNQQWAQGGREWGQQGGGYQQRRERQPQQKFEMPENIIQFNAVA
jgi:flagellar hook-length control protein FliK